MEQARILHCESDPYWREAVARVIGQTATHEIVAEAVTYSEALDRLKQIGKGVIDVNLVLLDSQLRGGYMLNHPKTIVGEMNRTNIILPVVGLSENGLTVRSLVLGRDYSDEVLKKEFASDPDKLLDILDQLDEPPKNWCNHYVQ